MLRSCCLLLSTGLLHAAEPESVPEWIGVLSETYRKQEGYIVTYHTEGENKSMDATLASDSRSGLAVLHMVFTREGQRMEQRQWSTEPGDMYLDTNGQRGHVLGLKAEMKAMGEIFSRTAGDELMPAYIPDLLLTKTRLYTGFGASSSFSPVWSDEVKDAKLGEVTGKAVTFITDEYGELTISRENGQVIRQLVIADDGEKRLLEQVSYRRNPGEEAIDSLTKDWQTAGARPIDNGITQGMRLSFFQDILRLIESGEMTLDQLKERMEARPEGLKGFAALCFSGNPESRLATMDWKGVAKDAKDAVREAWKKKSPGKEFPEKEFDELWARDGVKAANAFLRKFVEDKKVRRSVMEDIFGKAAELKASTPAGKEAREFIESKLSQAYLKEVIRRKLVPILESGKPAE